MRAVLQWTDIERFFRAPGLALAVSLGIAGCIFDGDLKRDTGVVPEDLNDGWEIGTPEEVGLSGSALESIHHELLREDRYRASLSLLVVKDGRLVFETYLRRRSDQHQYRHIQSATKSVTSLLFGIAMDQGYVSSLDLTTGEIFPDEVAGLDARKAEITLRDLLTMTSGIRFENDVFSVEMWVDRPRDPVRYMLEKPMFADPGQRFLYRDMDPQLVGHAIQRLSGKTERELAAETLFRTLGIRDYYWEAGPDGVNLAAHGLHLLPRDLAKLGQLMLDRGLWRGERVVSEKWIEESTRGQIDSDVAYEDGVFSYGYYWWVVPGIGYSMWGHGGQFVLVVPSRNMVLVQTAFPDSDLPDNGLTDLLELVRPLLGS